MSAGFEGRTLVIATMHRKEEVIAPLAEKYLGVTCQVPLHFDSDALGTFSGEVERTQPPLETARQKCLEALALTGETLGIASEGSFGPHPSAWFAPANEEVLLLLDTARELEVVVRKISLETNFAGAQVHTQEELQAFARQVLFPSHGLILSAAAGSTEGLQKGLTSWPQLLAAFRSLVASHGSAYVQTDMRALYNPTRMQVIKQAAQLLMERCTTCCPACHTPGFGVTQAIRGLPCRLCGLPTQSVRSLESACQRCSFTRQDDFPGGAQTEDPTYCEHCNP